MKMVEMGNLITDVSVQRVERDNKIISVWSEKAPITSLGIENLNGRSTSTMNQKNYYVTNSSLFGSQIGTENSKLYFNQSDFSSEIKQAISEIEKITELSEKNMKSIIELLKQIDIAVKSNNKEAQTTKKSTLKGMLKGIGNTGVKVINVLSGLANLANFFDFPTS